MTKTWQLVFFSLLTVVTAYRMPLRYRSDVTHTLYATIDRERSTDSPRTSIRADINDNPGSLNEVLGYFSKHGIGLTRIESRPSSKRSDEVQIFIDFEGKIGDSKVDEMIRELQNRHQTMILNDQEVDWFPRHISELDIIAHRTLDAGVDLESDHPGFKDSVYRQRRAELAEISKSYSFGDPLPRIEYTESEVGTWREIFRRLKSLQKQHACSEYLTAAEEMERVCGYSEDAIPQAEDISNYLYSRTGFQLRPVTGLLSSRDFLCGLAFRTFFSTQYIRHSSKPFYTPEPDVCHELLGHAPMFADPDFADLSQEIGLAALGASDETVDKLAHLYWHSVEFGLLKENNELKAYGAGLLSSFGELEWACSGAGDKKPFYVPWNPAKASATDYPVTEFQPLYFVAENLNDAKVRMRDYCHKLTRPFYARYDQNSQRIWVDRALKVQG